MPTIEGPITECPICGSAVWDNTRDKKNPKGPDYKCKTDKEHAFWLPKQTAKPKFAKPAPESQVVADARPNTSLATTRDYDLVMLYADSLDCILEKLRREKLSDFFSSTDIAAMCATLFIARSKG